MGDQRPSSPRPPIVRRRWVRPLGARPAPWPTSGSSCRSRSRSSWPTGCRRPPCCCRRGCCTSPRASVYRLPIPVQPLKAFGVIAIAQGLGVAEIAAGALLMGVIFLALGLSGLIDRAAGSSPARWSAGCSCRLGCSSSKLAWGLVAEPDVFSDTAVGLMIPATGLPRRGGDPRPPARRDPRAWSGSPRWWPPVTYRGAWEWGRRAQGAGSERLCARDSRRGSGAAQLPLTFTISCVATADAAPTRTSARRPTGPARTARRLASAPPTCWPPRSAGCRSATAPAGCSAHRGFGARTGGAPIAMGSPC